MMYNYEKNGIYDLMLTPFEVLNYSVLSLKKVQISQTFNTY